ncbi:hypothetical protein AB0B89_11800 [Sphaerisporangium sp. NPDC049002]|uniref:hypothetical protein n=1 Tax=unclassified Sphaerisporangium TaxID=2630420 RepID=UPI0033F583E3
MSTASKELLSQDISSELEEVIEGGWVVGPHGVLSLAALHDPELDMQVDHLEPFEVEYHRNEVWIPGDDLPVDREGYLTAICVRALTFSLAALAAARNLPGFDTLTAVISTGVDADWSTHGTTVKFFTRRGGYPNWFDDLESFEIEAVALLEASDVITGTQ